MRAYLLIVCLILSGFNSFGQGEYLLSETDVGYKFIEKQQECACLEVPDYHCFLTRTDCLRGLDSVLIANGHQKLDSSMLSLCDRVSTRFETPGAYERILNRYLQVERTAIRLGYPITERPKLGTLPIKEINASTLVKQDKNAFSVIFLNNFFTEFAHNITQLASNSLGRSSAQTGMWTYYQNIEEYLKNNPKAINHFVITLAFFVNGYTGSQLPHDRETDALVINYMVSMELFAIAHEYAHIYLGHIVSVNALHLAGGIPVGTADSTDVNEKEWEEEMAADFIAYKIIQGLYDEHTTKGKLPIDLLAAPALYFTARLITGEAEGVMRGIPFKPLSAGEERTSARLKKSFKLSVPKMEKAIARASAAAYASKHPHPSLRLQLATELLPLSKDTKDASEYSVLCERLRKNLLLMWQLSEAMLTKAAPTLKHFKKNTKRRTRSIYRV